MPLESILDNPKISFEDALKILNIEDYSERILNSNSHGELIHIFDYIVIALWAQEATTEPDKWFRIFFEGMVRFAEDKWERPESVFQHIPLLLNTYLEQITEGK